MNNYYARLLPQLVTSWRTAFRTNFTALIVQLAAYQSEDADPVARTQDPLPALRNTQYSVETLPSSGVVIAIDIGNQENLTWPCTYKGGIHPRNKTEVGRRLALKLAAIEGILPTGTLASGPIPSTFTMNSDNTGVTITMDSMTVPNNILSLIPTEDCSIVFNLATPQDCCQTFSKLNSVTGASFPFELLPSSTGAVFVIAQATIEANGVVLVTPFNSTFTGPFSQIRYAWQGFPLCALINSQGLPMGPFVHSL
jgi:hypothetical protein